MRKKHAEGWIGITEAASWLGVSRQAVHKMTIVGTLRYWQLKPNGQIYLQIEDVLVLKQWREDAKQCQVQLS